MQDIWLFDVIMHTIQNDYIIITSRVFCNYEVVVMESMALGINI